MGGKEDIYENNGEAYCDLNLINLARDEQRNGGGKLN